MFKGTRLTGRLDISSKDYLTKVNSAIDNNTIVVGSTSGSIDFVDASTLQKVLSLENGHRRNVTDIQPFFNQKDCYVSCGVDGFAYAWDCREKNTKPVQTFRLNNKKENDCYSLSINQDSTCVAAGFSNEVLLFDTRTAKKELTLFSHVDTVQCVRFHPAQANILLTGAEDGLVNIFNTNTFRKGISTEEEEAALDEEVNVPMTVVNTTQGVRTFELVGRDYEGLCTFTLGESVQLHLSQTGHKLFESDAVREHPSLAYEESAGHMIAPLYDKESGRLYVLGGSSAGALRVFEVNANGCDDGVALEVPLGQTGHTDIIRSAVRIADRIYTVAEDGVLCLWQPSHNSADEVDVNNGFRIEEEEMSEDEGKDRNRANKSRMKNQGYRPY